MRVVAGQLSHSNRTGMGRLPGFLLGEFSELRSRPSFVFEADPRIDTKV